MIKNIKTQVLFIIKIKFDKSNKMKVWLSLWYNQIIFSLTWELQHVAKTKKNRTLKVEFRLYLKLSQNLVKYVRLFLWKCHVWKIAENLEVLTTLMCQFEDSWDFRNP
jgi:hypothetical protein